MKFARKHLLFLALPLLSVAAVILWTVTGKNFLMGRYLLADNGSNIVIDRRGFPIVMRDFSDSGTIFDNLENGDQVLVVYTGAAESYPGRSGAYWCLCLETGEIGDLPVDTLHRLDQLGWISYSPL